jgi:hypothetical protein
MRLGEAPTRLENMVGMTFDQIAPVIARRASRDEAIWYRGLGGHEIASLRSQ